MGEMKLEFLESKECIQLVAQSTQHRGEQNLIFSTATFLKSSEAMAELDLAPGAPPFCLAFSTLGQIGILPPSLPASPDENEGRNGEARCVHVCSSQ